MLYRYVLISLFLTMSLNAFPHFNHEDFFSLDREMRGVKKITERTRSNWKTVSFFDKEGFLVRKVNYRRGKMVADYRYEFSISDTLLIVKSRELRNINNDPIGYMIHKFHYNYLGQCVRIEAYSSRRCLEKPILFAGNFVYIDNLLQSYKIYRERSKSKIIYTYSKNKKTRYVDTDFKYLVSDLTFENETSSNRVIFIFDNERLTDKVHINSNPNDAFIGGFVWYSSDKPNKVHIRYSNFDRHGN